MYMRHYNTGMIDVEAPEKYCIASPSQLYHSTIYKLYNHDAPPLRAGRINDGYSAMSPRWRASQSSFLNGT